MEEGFVPKLVTLTDEWKEPFIHMAEDWFESGEDKYQLGREDYDAYLVHLNRQTDQRFIQPIYVPMDTFFLAVSPDVIVGSSRLRSRLTPLLESDGGHIGYDVMPSMRGKGYATLILALTLEIARPRGIERALLTCDTDNLASARVIEKNGGVFDRHTVSHRTGNQVSRYWIDLRPGSSASTIAATINPPPAI